MNAHHRLLWVSVALSLAACARQERLREIDWARAALARNAQFEILATDEKAGVFTVRDTSTGALRTVHLNELVAGPLPSKESGAANPRARASDPGPAPANAGAPAAARGVAPVPGRPAPGPDSQSETQPESQSEYDPRGSTELAHAPVPQEGGDALIEGPGYRISRATGEPTEAAAATLEGPGYRIERQEPSRIPGSAATETPLTAGAQRRSDPIICQGNRRMHIDGETIEFTGDAVIAEKGCDLFISNARIRAGGVGIIAREQGRVHVVNSTIGGALGSYEASQGGAIYVTRSTFEGVGRRFDGGSLTDLGGNRYESH